MIVTLFHLNINECVIQFVLILANIWCGHPSVCVCVCEWPGGAHGKPFQYSCLENPMDRGTWWATAHGVAKNQTRLKQLSTHACVCEVPSHVFWLYSNWFFFFFATWGLKSSLYIPDISALLDVLLANTFLSGCYLPFSSSQKGVHRLVFNLIRSNKIFSLYG